VTRFKIMRFRGGPWDGDLSRVQLPLPERLLIPVIAGKERTWGRDRTTLAGVCRYELRTSARRAFYAALED
jgi:hypothetical protein